MSKPASRLFVTSFVILGAVVFGMVLAGGLDWTPPAQGEVATPAYLTNAVSTTAGPFPSFADLAEAVDPAVVSIQAATIERRQRGRNPLDFFRRQPDRRRQQEEQPPEEFRSDSGGSGFVISPDGLIVTNNHVIDEADDLRVRLNGREYPATVKGVDPATDIALLKVEAGNDLTYLKLGDSETVRVGDWVMAIGSPLRLDKSVTVGVVSAKGRTLGISNTSFENFIQTDAAINFGNSGGPLVNMAGEVVGINTAINYGAENIGFAVPANILQQILPQLRDTGRVRRGYLGVNISNLDYDAAQYYGLESTNGALVGQVVGDTPAARAGLRPGDVILEVDGRDIEETRDLIDYVSAKGPDSSVDLKILRDGKTLTRKVVLGEREDTQVGTVEPEEEEESGIEWLGIGYQELTPGLKEMHSIDSSVEGVWISRLAPTSPLYDEGVQVGNVITEVNGEAASSAERFEELVNEVSSGGFLRLYVVRLGQGGQTQGFFAFVRVP